MCGVRSQEGESPSFALAGADVIRNSQETSVHGVFYIAAFTESVHLGRLSPTCGV